jgi:hypothetical protein
MKDRSVREQELTSLETPAITISTRGQSIRAEDKVVINEIMLDPAHGGPWIELFNYNIKPVSVDDWIISDEDGLIYQFDDLPDMPAKSYLVVHFDDGVSDTYFGQTQVNALHIYSGWKNVMWTKHYVDSDELGVQAAIGYDIVPGGKPEVLVNKFKSGKFFYESKVDMSDEWNINPITPQNLKDNHRIKPIDVDGDGNTDIVSIYCFIASTFRVNWIRSTGNPKAVWDGTYEIDDMVGLVGLEAGDINGDNRMDVVVSQSDAPNENIFWYECPLNPTVNPWSRYTIDNTLTQPGGLALADLDGDNDNDLVAVGSWGEEVVWYEHPPNPVNPWTKHTIATPQGPAGPAPNPQFDGIGELIVEDIDNDQKLDVIVSESKSNRIVWYEYQTLPTGAWTPTVIDNNILGPSGLDVEDFDTDGDLDIIVAATGGTITWYPQPTQPQTPIWPRYIIDDSLHLVFYVNATDLDGDGDLDLTTADRSDAKVLWYENEFVQFSDPDQCALYNSPLLTPAEMVDFVAWGGAAGTDDDNAVTLGIWQDGTYVDTTSSATNQTIARDKLSTDTDMPVDWDANCGKDSDIPTFCTVNYPSPTNVDLDLVYNPVIFMGGLETLNSTPPDSMPTGLCLANYSSYTFRVNVSNPWGWSELDYFRLNLTTDPMGPTLYWNQNKNEFNVINDPTGSVTLVQDACTSEMDYQYNWHLNLTVIFHWGFPYSGSQDVVIISKNYLGYQDLDHYPGFYEVINTLNFTGEIAVKDNSNGELLDFGDWVIPGQELQVTGPKVIYATNGTGEYYPADSAFNVQLEDNYENTWLDYSSTSGSVNFSINIPLDIQTGQYMLSLSLIDLPNGAVLNGLRSQELSIDASDLDFSDPYPDGNTWMKQFFNCSIKISDQQNESGIDNDTVEYRIATISPERVGEWRSAYFIFNREFFTREISSDFDEGPNNWIQWRAQDVAGNGPVTSELYRVPVDRQILSYHDIYPHYNLVQKSSEVTVNITIADFGGSGVDIDSIEAAVKPSGQDEYNDWFNPDFTIEDESLPSTDALECGPELIKISMVIDQISNGANNQIKFRAKDVAGNGPYESDGYSITLNLDVISPSTVLKEPQNNSVIRTQYPILKWTQTTSIGSSNLYYNVFISQNKNDFKLLSNESGSFLTKLPGGQEELDLAYSGSGALESNVTYYWTIIPVYFDSNTEIIGKCSSGIWNFVIYLEEYGVELRSDEIKISLFKKDNTTVDIRIRNLGTESDSYSLTTVSSGNIAFGLSKSSVDLSAGGIEDLRLELKTDGTQEVGTYNISIIATSQNSVAKDTLILEITVISEPDEGETKSETQNYLWVWVLVLLIIIIIFIIITIWNYLKYKKSQSPPREPDAKPAPEAEQLERKSNELSESNMSDEPGESNESSESI